MIGLDGHRWQAGPLELRNHPVNGEPLPLTYEPVRERSIRTSGLLNLHDEPPEPLEAAGTRPR